MTALAMGRPSNPALRRYIVVETLVGTAVNTAISVAIAWLAFHGHAQVPTHGGFSLVTDAIPQTFMVAMMSVLPVSLFTRVRARRGRVLPRAPWGGWGANRNLTVRAVSLAALATVVGFLGFRLLAPALAPDGVSFAHVLILKAVYGAAVSIVVIPFATLAALKDVA